MKLAERLKPEWVSCCNDPKHPPGVWTALYLNGKSCFNVEFGHQDGPPITQETAVRMAQNYLKKHRIKMRGYYIRCVVPGGRRGAGF